MDWHSFAEWADYRMTSRMLFLNGDHQHLAASLSGGFDLAAGVSL